MIIPSGLARIHKPTFEIGLVVICVSITSIFFAFAMQNYTFFFIYASILNKKVDFPPLNEGNHAVKIQFVKERV